MEKELYKNRSIAACIKQAFLLFCSNVMPLIKSNWIAVLVFSVLGSVCTICNTQVTNIETKEQTFINICCIIAYILMFASLVWYATLTTNMLNNNGVKCNLLRHIRLAVLVLAISAILLIAVISFFIISVQSATTSLSTQHPSTSIIIWIYPVVFVVVLILLMPFTYAFQKYINEPNAKFKSHVMRGYLTGLKCLGFILPTLFLFGIILLVTSAVLGMPLTILETSQILSKISVTQGDANTLPSYFYILLSVTSFISYIFVMAIITIAIYICYYIYGTVEAKIKEKRERQQIQKETLKDE